MACTEYLAEALEAYRNVETCQHLILVDYPGKAAAIGDAGVHRFEDLVARGARRFRDRGHVARRYRRHRLHQRHHRQAQGGRAVALQFVLPVPRAAAVERREASQDDEVRMAVLPLFHSYGQTCVMNTVLAHASTLTLMPRFDPAKAMEVIQRDKVTHFAAVPTMYLTMLNHPERAKYDLSSLRMCATRRRADSDRNAGNLAAATTSSDSRGLRPDRDFAHGHLEPGPRRAADRLLRQADLGLPDQDRRRQRQHAAGRARKATC